MKKDYEKPELKLLGDLHALTKGQPSQQVSDRSLKANVQGVDSEEILERLSQLPVSSWSYIWEDSSVRHIGPMAQDFSQYFSLGDSDRTINTIDCNGVLMLSIQALNKRLQHKEERIQSLENRLAALERRLSN